MKRMKLQIKKLLSYSVVFPERHDTITDLLTLIPSISAIEFISYQLARKVNQLVNEHDIRIWAPWVMNTRSDVKNPVGHYAQEFNLANYALIDEYSMLLLISRLISCYNGRNDEMTTDDYSNLFLAYLICCDDRISLSNVLPNNSMSADDFTRSFMPNYLKVNDIEAPRDYRLLLIKCYMLLIDFPKHNERFATYITTFCKERGVIDANNYLKEIFITFLNMSPASKLTCVMEMEDKHDATYNFLDRLCINPDGYKHDNDFREIREFPILKTGISRYNILYMRMFLDKAYNGLLFDMKDALVKNGTLDAKNGYMNLKSFLGEEFSERFFFYTLMKRCFGKRYVNYSGDVLKETFGEGMPDYYLRRGNRIFVFECKDVLLASKSKLSGDYDKVKDAIFEKFVVNTKGHPKGVSQLCNVIENKLSLILSDIDKEAPTGTMYIFPILVYFDNTFDVEGPNYLLNKKFKELWNKAICPDNFVIKDIVMVNIEQLMRLEDFFANDKLKLATLINAYVEYKNLSELNKVFPFNKFLFQEAKKKGYELRKTKWFNDVFANLVAED